MSKEALALLDFQKRFEIFFTFFSTTVEAA
jgi:hypothetical protein